MTSAQARVTLPGSERAPGTATGSSPADGSEVVDVTLVLRRKNDLPAGAVDGPGVMSRSTLEAAHGASPADVALVTSVLEPFGVTVSEVHASSRRLTVTGPLSALTTAFGTSLVLADGGRRREGGLSLPAELAGVVTAVLGLDDRPAARARTMRPLAATSVSYPVAQLGEVYDFPPADGAGQTVAIVELGGGFTQADLDVYFGHAGVAPAPVTVVGVDGATNSPGQDADGEVDLDIEVIGVLAPGAQIVCLFAPNTDRGFLDAVATAVHGTPTPAAVSISWGQSEDQWTPQARTSLDDALADAAALGVTVTVAAGDNGSTDNQAGGAQHCDFPASSPHALACGGTHLVLSAGGIPTETVWATHGSTGGGVSDAFPLPSWQKDAGVPVRAKTKHHGRGVPDVAGVADPETGYQVRINGVDTVIGGTSAVAPLWAALVARLVEALGRPLGLLQPLLYAGGSPGAVLPGFRDITSGSNGAYAAAAGWDPCTGLGVPVGSALLARLEG